MARGHVWGGCMAGVCMVGGMCGQGACMAGGMHGRGKCMAGGVHGGGVVHATHAPQQILRLRHMVNEWTVRILLECILVNLTIQYKSVTVIH